ncbi:hypothetical protein [Streptomyces cinerochromogenes]|uniref:hypothetical protein n=1 Tax=Streptomyces cinerochromogenes TaxID=66422 RepID=UPI001670A129|nr:hypothetical protein [Streptomyces cinerochromogenes]
MIGSWGSADGRPGRRRRAALLVGLVLVIAAHLSGAVHACTFAGPDATAAVARHGAPVVAEGGTDSGGSTVPPPPHRHAADGHADHTADRPRPALDDTGLGDETDQPLRPAVSNGRFTDTARHRPPGTSPSCGDGPSLAVVCVRRQ